MLTMLIVVGVVLVVVVCVMGARALRERGR
jgi:hypothetical protein